MLADPTARVLPIWKGKPLIAHGDAPDTGWLTLDTALMDDAVAKPIFLGLEADAPRFAVDVSAWTDPDADPDALRAFVDRTENHHPALPETHRFTALRLAMAYLPSGQGGTIATARSLMEWHRTHLFCSRCGARSEADQAGWRRVCGSCGGQHFPRTDPVVIMLITRGDQLLLGRSPGWPETMYSLLAGFVEPGETIEAAVRREVVEESGIAVGDVSVLATQPWPFPSSLMIGCAGEATSEDIKLDPAELEDAMWVSRERVVQAMAGHDPDLMPARPGAIARALIARWLRDTL
jgi:NAD+ diphosphatase